LAPIVTRKGSMAHGFFGNLNENIVAKEKFVAMRDETMLIHCK
jgi:hypothetical protein